MQPDQTNTLFTLASDLVNKTNQHIFLTGKAGTGKTTFLKYIKENTVKNTVVVAPTGVAAINAGGVTMHSFFQLPFSPYLPQSYNSGFGSTNQTTDKNSLFKNIKFNSDKRKLLNELQLLIIDEISMVRADMLDAIDAILRHFRRRQHIPFGGVQVLYIGDMYQLPPVVPDAEWRLLENYYESPFFFSANAIKESGPLYVELKKIYRQKDQQFIDILNRVRNNHTSIDDLAILNDLYKPTYNYKENNSILLTTHNYKANLINQQELDNLATPLKKFKGEIEGDFNDKLLPNDLELELKVGAQIMFIKNDSSPEKKYFNGKLAIIDKIEKETITVLFEENKEAYELKKETWKNIRYKLNDKNEIEEDELGSYTQYPIRLAWAITIHKSQGLTFEKAIIDAGQSFAAGQVYVALSRCTNMEGLVLHSIIPRSAINTDERIIAFAKQEAKQDELQRVLELEKESFLANQLIVQFDFYKLIGTLQEYANLVPTKAIPNAEQAINYSNAILDKATNIQEVATKFLKELKLLLYNVEKDKESLLTRTQKAIDYFTKEIIDHILHPIQEHCKALATASKVKQYLAEVKKVEQEVWSCIVKLNNSVYDDFKFNQNNTTIEAYNPTNQKIEKKQKLDSASSAAYSAQLYNEGKSIDEVALTRNLAISTVEGHLALQVRKGLVDINKLVDRTNLQLILDAIAKDGGHSITPIKALLPDTITYNQIRAVLNYKDWLVEKEKGI